MRGGHEQIETRPNLLGRRGKHMTAGDIARALGAKGRGPRWVARCPAHDDQSPSLSIGTGANGRILLNCFVGCSFGAIVAALWQEHGLRLDDDRARQHDHRRPASRPSLPQPIASPDKITDILRAAVSLPGRLGEHYLRARGCAMPAGDSVRLPPSVKYPWPTILSIITDFVTGEPISLHFTMLNKDGTDKAPIDRPRRLLAGHRKSGGVIRLTDDCDVERHLGIAEGIESALAVTANAAGREVFIVQPPAAPGSKRDWNE